MRRFVLLFSAATAVLIAAISFTAVSAAIFGESVLNGNGRAVVIDQGIAITPAPQPFPPQPFPPAPDESQLIIRSYRVNVTIDNQIATTQIEQDFVNLGGRPAEGAYLFPLPVGAAVSNLTMIINGQPIQAQILDANQARAIYTDTVRRLRDPALLQYIGRSAIQANVFPIPAGEERKIQITYSHILSAENSLLSYNYPLKADYLSHAPIQQVSVSVDVTSKDPISSVYSPDALVAISRLDDHHVKAGFETSNYLPSTDFQLYYAITTGAISGNVLTYRTSADEDGYFMLLLTPPTSISANLAIPKDVVLVLDQSGSMQGPKWDQARSATGFVLKHLNPNDRFNVIVFSTGYRIFAQALQKVDQADAAASWVNGLQAEGGTDINGALTEALSMTDPARQTTLLFMTDGEPTEGQTDLNTIIQNVQAKATPNLRVFTFGVGDDVNTYLLDSLATDFHGASVYVRPTDNIEDKVSNLYNKITSPVLTNIKLDFGGVTVEDLYPSAPLPDLFAGSQLIVTGRFRGTGTANVTLSGDQNGKAQSIAFPALSFPANAGGQPFVARLWATRKIGYLLNQIRLHGETAELVDEVTRLSVRYGIITPYTAYLIQESDIHAQTGEGGRPIALLPTGNPPSKSMMPVTGGAAVQDAQNSNSLAGAAAPALAPTYLATNAPAANGRGAVNNGMSTAAATMSAAPSTVNSAPIKQVGDRTFIQRGGVWIDTQYVASNMTATPVTAIVFASDAYFNLLAAHPDLADVFALGNHIIVVISGTVYEIKAA